MIFLNVVPCIGLSVHLLSVVTVRVVIKPGGVFDVVKSQFYSLCSMGEDAVNERTMCG